MGWSHAVAAVLRARGRRVVTAEPVVLELDPEPDQFDDTHIDDLLALSKHMRWLQRARGRINEKRLLAEAERERIDVWLDQATESDRKRVAFLEAQIAAYMLRRRRETGEKTTSTPSGRAETRELPVQYVKDETVLIPWAAERGYIRQKVSDELDWKRLKEESVGTAGGLLWNGEPVPGVEIVEREPSVQIVTWEK